MAKQKNKVAKLASKKKLVHKNDERLAIKNGNQKPKTEFPRKFPFWARLKIEKRRSTLVIDEEEAYNKKNKRMEPGFVHREVIHSNEDGRNVKGYEEIVPNPDPDDKRAMFLKGPSKKPKRLFKPHEKNWPIPKHLIDKYDKNNKKEQ